MAPHRVDELLHGPGQAGPHEECGPALPEEHDATEDAAKRDVAMARFDQSIESALSILIVAQVRPPFAVIRSVDRPMASCGRIRVRPS